MEPSFFIYFGGVLLMFINPVQFPLHEPYFDLTPIKVTHTKIVWKKYLIIVQPEGKIFKKPNLLRIPLSAPDEWLVPIWDKIHRDVVTHDY